MNFEIGKQYIVDDPDNVTQRNGSILEITEIGIGSGHYYYIIIKNTNLNCRKWLSQHYFGSGTELAEHLIPYVPGSENLGEPIPLTNDFNTLFE